MAVQQLLEKVNFSIDQPFGIRLDDYFSKGYELVTGGKSIDSFVFQEGPTPLSTQHERLELLYYLNYLVKYWELADTALLVLKKKPLEFLHYFHHSMTMILCFVQLRGHTSVSWVPIALNLTVHVLVYYNYMRSSAGILIRWKQYLTTLQLSNLSSTSIEAKAAKQEQQQHRGTDMNPTIIKSGDSGSKKSKSKRVLTMLK
ncbi:Elongation of very long chain fatty acids protein 5 [Linnemannia schmuckeri]|uniref:Elongation of fatty acids protein n=1 Tax=Linnemannia schmuckeri TaxID=64567 RepID=A0A9P5V981_9FUNG|nr:Elongation of very long chain fatty acids protein 5 [Linnemannia schmuckeri]